MLLKSDVYRIVSDFFRTELARRQADALAVFETENEDDFFDRLPQEVRKTAFEKAATFFDYEPKEFSSFDLMVDFAYASYLKNRHLNFLTSGSTGVPKKCVHTEEMLREEANGVKDLFKPVKRIVSLVPSSHLYGCTFTICLPHVLRVPVKVLPALPTQPWEDLLQEGDLVTGFPLFWNYWLRAGNHFKPGIMALSSTAPCKDEIINDLFRAGLTNFVEIYGSSETGVIGTRTNAGSPFTIPDFWEISSRGNEIKIKRKSQSEWLLLPDEVDVIPPRQIRPLRRRDACVQVAGINVYPRHVEHILARHPAVKACRVRLMRPEEGERLKAFIVLNEGFSPDHVGIIRTYLSQKVTVHEMPRSFTFGKQLPVAALGKDTDW